MWHVVCFSESALARYFRAKMKKLGAVTVSNRDVPSLTLAKSNLPNAVAFPVEDMPYALAVLEISQPVFTPLDDPRFKLLLREDVTVLLPPGEGTWAVKATLRPFAEELGEKIVVVNAGGSCLPPTKSPSVLRIYIHCAPALAGSPQAPSYTTIGQAWGIPLPCGVCDAITPTGIGKPIITTDEAMTIAEVLDGVVYVLADITHPASNSGEIIREVLSRILEKYLLMRLPKRRADDQDPKAAYVRACLQRARLRRALLQAKAHELTVELERLGNLLLEKTRERERVLSELHCLEQTGPDLAEIEQEWEALVRYPHVKQIKIKGDFLIVHTDEILIQRWGKSFMLGPYEIRIPFDGGRVFIHSKEPRLYKNQVYSHPHCWGLEEANFICYGSIAADVPKLLANRKYFDLVDVLVAFLHEINDKEDRARTLLQELWTPLPKPRLCSCKHKQQEEGS